MSISFPLANIEQKFYPLLPLETQRQPFMEQWIDAALHARDWHERATQFDGLLQSALMAAILGKQATSTCLGALASYVTAAVEHLEMGAIAQLDSAWAYRFCLHKEWSDTAARFIGEQKRRHLARWFDDHPGFATWAELRGFK
ncbi:hypothetical protein [Bradyrhizobium sp. ERR14]|uniref:hypothetical protein n=1 Tax=Bradyrhizobium sp. ERR14 TaxID=2663837 RepID=UPI001620F21C|nr:hypothetical protein [Bradyrhizobium sp. ERR14]MBB4391824.1 hypothetical protein [Bradyrhizobium sp. ERR14]